MTIHIGQIINWYQATIPTNFQICDGTGGTPDLRAKFVRGKSTDLETPLTSGSNSHSHTGLQSSTYTDASHDHSYSTSISAAGATNVWNGGNSVSISGHTHGAGISGTTGASSYTHSHDCTLASATSLPPYILLYFIMKVA